MGKSITPEVIEKFWQQVGLPDNGCWPWMGRKSAKGYGWLHLNKMSYLPYRVAFELAFGAIPAGLHIDHLCRNPQCVNPYHLDAVTPRTNILRGECLAAKNARMVKCSKGHEFAYNEKFKHRYCHECSEERWRLGRISRREAGLCVHCKRTPDPVMSMCAVCLKNKRESRKRRAERA